MSVFPNVVPEKGANEFVVAQIVNDIDLMGYTEIIFKTDNESSIVALQQTVKQKRQHKIVLENSIKGASQTNGFIENANRTVAAQIRTMRSALNTNLGCKVHRDHTSMTWLVKYAGTLINMFHVGKDGRTAYQRRKGKTTHPVLVPLGEKILYKPVPDKRGKPSKLDDRFSMGSFMASAKRAECTILEPMMVFSNHVQ